MASTFSQKLLLLSLLMLFVSAISAEVVSLRKNQEQSPRSGSLAKLQAEKLIRGLNLFPKDDVNAGIHDLTVEASKIVEKKFRFPVLGAPGPSVQEFGHHAGYYKLPHAKAAR